MKTNKFQTLCLTFIVVLSISFHHSTIKAQSRIAFTNKVLFTKTGSMSGIRLIALLPVPQSNEYQEIQALSTNNGIIDKANAANKVLFYDGPFTSDKIEIAQSFYYITKKVKIDFNDKTNKNVDTDVDPSNYLNSDGKFIDLNNKTIKQIGDELWNKASDELDYARLCYEYVASHYKYINGSWRTLAEIIRIGGGECGDFTTLFVNLMRYKNIPARHNMGVWVDGGYHVWPDFYHEDYGWIPVDPTFKNSNPLGDYFGRYDGNLIILSQGLTTFSKSGVSIDNVPLQTFYYWYWYSNGNGNINGEHQTCQDYQVDGIDIIYDDDVYNNEKESTTIYNINGIKQKRLTRGINIINGKKVWTK